MSEQVENKTKRTLEGIVVSNKNDKTIVVNVERRYKHASYGKFVTLSKKYHAHDVNNQAELGDRVANVESKSYSKMKKWELVKIIK